ncbi:PHP domain-containing protein [Spirochaetota bacterium]
MYVDLHVHSQYSDGSDSIERIFSLTKERNISFLSITDHDTIASQGEAVTLSRSFPNITYITGTELSSHYNGMSVHILGYNFDHTNKSLQSAIARIQDARQKRNMEMISLLASHDIPLSPEDIPAFSKELSVGRVHIAQAMKTHGYVKSIKEAFTRYIGDRSPCYVKRWKYTVDEITEIIRKAGGISVLAHPSDLGLKKNAYADLFSYMKSAGIEGVEAYYSKSKKSVMGRLAELAKRFDLCITCGSDHHGIYSEKINIGYGMNGNLKKTRQHIDEFFKKIGK